MSGVSLALVGAGGSPFTGSAVIVTDYDYPFYGYRSVIGPMGTLTPSTWGASKLAVSAILANPNGAGNFQFSVAGMAPNTGWSTMTVGSTVFNRADATYNFNGGFTLWLWDPVASNPLPSVGYTTTIVWA